MGYNPLLIGDEANSFLELPPEINIRLKELWDALAELEEKVDAIDTSLSFDELTDTPAVKTGSHGKILEVDAINNQIIYVDKPVTAEGAVKNSFLCNYLLYAGEYHGNIHFQLQISEDKDFTNLEVNADSGSNQENWDVFNGDEWEAMASAGMPSNYPQVVYSGFEFTDGRKRYVRWRTYYNGTYSDWVGGVL